MPLLPPEEVTIAGNVIGGLAAATGIVAMVTVGLAVLVPSVERAADYIFDIDYPFARDGGGRSRRQIKDIKNYETLMKYVRHLDFNECGLRLACELGRKNSSEYTKVELAVWNFIGRSIRPEKEGLIKGPHNEYRLALGKGERGIDCLNAYPYCLLTREEVFSIANEAVL